MAPDWVGIHANWQWIGLVRRDNRTQSAAKVETNDRIEQSDERLLDVRI